ncbi:uncharacterized protein LOC128204991 [Mya arenaria]|uniref:uncharacterized protein LOC128204991 n=1 Tax=Mya arenaria TaxID=6604 RepID=UPI0022E3EA1B|nr:uncharacterized protein LOC128204991 [Mya arenaria]
MVVTPKVPKTLKTEKLEFTPKQKVATVQVPRLKKVEGSRVKSTVKLVEVPEKKSTHSVERATTLKETDTDSDTETDMSHMGGYLSKSVHSKSKHKSRRNRHRSRSHSKSPYRKHKKSKRSLSRKHKKSKRSRSRKRRAHRHYSSSSSSSSSRSPSLDKRGKRYSSSSETEDSDQGVRGNPSKIPKYLTYDGVSNWTSFKVKFDSYRRAMRWTDEESLDYLSWCLQGKALDHYSLMVQNGHRLSFRRLMRMLDNRFGTTELPETARAKFDQACQNGCEALEDWADRVLMLATPAYREFRHFVVQREAVKKFCQGCTDKEAGKYACLRHPSSMEEALNFIKEFQYTTSAMESGRRKRRPDEVQFNVVDDSRNAHLEKMVESLTEQLTELKSSKGKLVANAYEVQGFVHNEEKDTVSYSEEVCEVGLKDSKKQCCDEGHGEKEGFLPQNKSGFLSDKDSPEKRMGGTKVPEHLSQLFENSSNNLDEQQKNQLADLLCNYGEVFAINEFDLGSFSTIEHTIDTGDARPIKQRMRKTPACFVNEEEAHLKKMVDAGVIQESVSDWASAPVLIRKRDGSVRWCVDYRALNDVTVKDTFPLPLVDDCLDTLAGSVWFSKLDANCAYWQVKISEADRKKTAFLTKYGLFEHVRMGFGLTNAPATFSRVVNLILRGMNWKTVLAFLDDILVLGKSFEDHMHNLAETLERFKKQGMKLKPKKCVLFQKKVEFLGRIVSENEIAMADRDIETVVNCLLHLAQKM